MEDGDTAPSIEKQDIEFNFNKQPDEVLTSNNRMTETDDEDTSVESRIALQVPKPDEKRVLFRDASPARTHLFSFPPSSEPRKLYRKNYSHEEETFEHNDNNIPYQDTQINVLESNLHGSSKGYVFNK